MRLLLPKTFGTCSDRFFLTVYSSSDIIVSNNNWTVLEVLNWTKGYLGEKGIENSRRESEWLLCEALGLDRVGLYLNFDRPLHPSELNTIRGMVSRRARREPLQYILGTQEFMGLEFKVSPAVLIPRHDTEALVVEAIGRCPQPRRILDIGTGSGCIAITLSRHWPEAEVFGVDTSAAALAIARENAERLGARVSLKEGSYFDPFPAISFDLIISNPPYIPAADLAGLQPEVRDFEPRAALDGGEDGLDSYRAIIPAASNHLFAGGWLMVEVGAGEAPPVRRLFEESGYGDLFTAMDGGGVERVVGGRLK
jgi:release factor glutamine methyltransferase